MEGAMQLTSFSKTCFTIRLWSSRSPLTASAPEALICPACESRRTRPVTVCPWPTSSSRTFQPMKPGPMTKTFLGVLMVEDGSGRWERYLGTRDGRIAAGHAHLCAPLYTIDYSTYSTYRHYKLLRGSYEYFKAWALESSYGACPLEWRQGGV